MSDLVTAIKLWINAHPYIVAPTLGAGVEEVYRKHPWLEFCTRLVVAWVIVYTLYSVIESKVPLEFQVLCYFFIGLMGYDGMKIVLERSKEWILELLESVLNKYK